MSLPTFVAIDFETADARPQTACALGAVRVEKGDICARMKSLLHPPRSNFRFSRLHGIGPENVKDAPKFPEIWPELERFLYGAHFIAAHNASFDRTVFHVLCLNAGVLAPPLPFVCTQALAKSEFDVPSGHLAVVCAALKIELVHHDPLSDAEAAATIVLRAFAQGSRVHGVSR